jgi:hypothetical protein
MVANDRRNARIASRGSSWKRQWPGMVGADRGSVLYGVDPLTKTSFHLPSPTSSVPGIAGSSINFAALYSVRSDQVRYSVLAVSIMRRYRKLKPAETSNNKINTSCTW